MFYTIRHSIIAVFVICYIFLVIKGRQHSNKSGTKPQITTKEYVISILVLLGIAIFCIAMFYPFEQSFMTFKTEKDAFNYIRIDCSDFDRFEIDDAIFYVERDPYKDKLYSLNKKDGRFGFVNYATQSDTYSAYLSGDIECFDDTIPPKLVKKLKKESKVGFDVDVIYNKTANITFYNVVLNHLKNPNENTASLNGISLTFHSTNDRPFLNSTYKAYNYYCYIDGEPFQKMCIKAEDACCLFNKSKNIRIPDW